MMNLPNKLTIFRIILVPIMVIVFYLNINTAFLGIPITFLIIDLLFIIASITDKLDGYLARSRNQVTNFGKFLDPIADKILVLAALILLVEANKIPAWIPIIIIFREFVVSGYRLIASTANGQVIAASNWGKIKTVTQMIAIILCYIDKFSFGQFIFRTSNKEIYDSISIYMTTGQYIINIVATIMLLVCVIATVFSGIAYLKNGKEVFKEPNKE